jgi:hypothetical protein
MAKLLVWSSENFELIKIVDQLQSVVDPPWSDFYFINMNKRCLTTLVTNKQTIPSRMSKNAFRFFNKM